MGRLPNEVRFAKGADKALRRAPPQIVSKMAYWVRLVEKSGLAAARLVKSFHDEPLKGERKGQRSIRLNRTWRAIYTTTAGGTVEFVDVHEVTPHKY